MKYFGVWDCSDEVHKDFLGYGDRDDGKRLKDFPNDDDILFASYTSERYEGYATVLFKSEGKFYIVEGSHCSCYGLEGQWEPDEVIPEQLLKMEYGKYRNLDQQELDAWASCVAGILGTIN